MSYSFRTHAILANALGDDGAASDLKSAVDAATGGVGTNPSVATLATSGNATIGGTCSVTGATTLSGTALISGNATVSGTTTHSDSVLIASGKVLKINGVQVVGAQQSAPANLAVTFTASAPSTYASPTGALTIANGGTPTVAELVAYCDELRGVIANILTVLHTHGLTT